MCKDGNYYLVIFELFWIILDARALSYILYYYTKNPQSHGPFKL